MMPDLAVQSKPASICVLRLSAIGDTCHALAVIRRLQDNWPDATICWIIGKTEASLMADINDIEFVVFDKSRGRRAFKDVSAELDGRHFDVALCMHASMRANLLCRRIPATVRLGFDKARARDFQWLFTDQRIAPAHGEHALEAMMSFATAIGTKERDLRWDIPLSADAMKFPAPFLDTEKPLVVVSPCSSQRRRNFRNWSVDNFAAIIRYLQQNYSCNIVLTGATSDTEQHYGAMLSSSGAVDLMGRTSLQELLALIRAAELVICPDSGPAHMATAAGTAVIGLYATSNPDRTGPYLSRDLTVNRYPDAVKKYLKRPTGELRWGQRVRDPNAMDLITIEDVRGKIDEFFAKS